MTDLPRPFTRVQERHYSAHHSLLHVARLELERAEEKQPGWFNSLFITLTFSALAVEAMSNAIGDRVVPDWKDFESASPTAKVRLLAERLQVPYSADNDPWKTVRWLAKFRNQIAHPKPEVVVYERKITEEEAESRPTEPPESRLERDVTLGNAKRALAAVESMKALFCDRVPVEERFGLFSDGWSTSTHRHDGA